MSHISGSMQLFGVVTSPEVESAVLNVLRSGCLAGGEYVAEFEKKFGSLIQQENVVAFSDMTSALFTALYLAGIEPGDEVITSAYACMSTNSAIAQHQAVPVWADYVPNTLEIDCDDVVRKITEKTKAVILYHVGGYPGPAKKLSEICKKNNLILIEDCNNSLLATRDGLLVGSFGDYSVYSFYPNRQINTIDGGALTVRNYPDLEKAKCFRRYGINPNTFRTALGEIDPQSDIKKIGWSFCMSNVSAAMGSAQLSTVEARVFKSRVNANILDELLSGVDGIQLMPLAGNASPAYWVYFVFVDHQEAVIREMKTHGINVSAVHMRNDLYSCFNAAAIQLPGTDIIQNRIIGLPCGWWLSDADMNIIATALKKCVINLV